MYTVHETPGDPPVALVSHDFCWPAFFFGPLWLSGKKLWLPAATCPRLRPRRGRRRPFVAFLPAGPRSRSSCSQPFSSPWKVANGGGGSARARRRHVRRGVRGGRDRRPRQARGRRSACRLGGGRAMTVAIVDYGSGNLHSARKAFERAARESGLSASSITVTADPDVVRTAERVVLPGVGAFADCRNGLAAVDGMVDALTEAARTRGRPFLGICVGMQLLASRGLEYETVDGLDWIAGDVVQIEPADSSLKVPHMGWNTLTRPARASAIERPAARRNRPARLFCPLLPFSYRAIRPR